MAQGRLRAALSGGDVVAFAPLTWARLPEFLHVAREREFWLNVSATQRLLGDAAAVCAADACVVPLLPRLRSPEASPADSAASPATGAASPAAAGPAADEIVTLPEVTAAVRLLARLAEVGLTDLIGELPTLAELGSLLPDAAPEDIEDALTDLVRAGAEAGADAVVIRGADRRGADRQDADRQDAGRSVDAVAPLADFYGVPVLGVNAERGWSAGNCCPVGLLRSDGQWPDLAHGVVLTAGDVTDWWTPQQMRSVLRQRQDARP